MIDEVLICNKYAEYSRQYKDEHIDDFETFVIARVADYFVNTQNASTSEIYEAIKTVLFDSSNNTEQPDPFYEIHEEEADEEPKVKKKFELPRNHEYSKSKPKDASGLSRADKVMLQCAGALAIAGVAIIGTVFIIARKSKRGH